MSMLRFILCLILVSAIVFAGGAAMHIDYVFFAGYVVLQYIVLATAWNILGGYAGYLNFGVSAFFALGAYTTVALDKALHLPLPIMILGGGVISGLVGLGMGYLTLRLKGIFFAIGTFALAIVAETFITNWDYVGGSGGAYMIRPKTGPLAMTYIEYLFLLMLILVIVSLALARWIERAKLGYGLAAIRDDELAAESTGVPTLRLKLIATTLSGALMGMAGGPMPYYVTFVDPSSAFNLSYAINSIAMPMIGGTLNWVGPLVGAVLLGVVQQVATVTISSEINLLIVGGLLVIFIIAAPNGITGMAWGRKRRGP